MNEFSRRIAAPGLATLQDTERQMRPVAPAQPQQPQQAEQQGRTVLNYFEDIARETGVPVNVLLTDERLNGVEDGTQAVEVGRTAAQELSQHFQEGRRLTEALQSATGDERRARQWTDAALAAGRQLYPDRFPENTNAENIARATGSGAVGLIGRGLEFVADTLGGAVDVINPFDTTDVSEALGMGDTLSTGPAEDWLFGGVETVGEYLVEGSERIRQGMDTQALQAMQDTMPSAETWYDPRTWTLGESPSLEGATLLVANVMGSLAPVIASGGLAGTPGAIIAGGAGAGGDAQFNAREAVMQAFDEGRLGDVSAYYNSLLQEGFNEQEAAERTAQAAERVSGLFGAVIGGAGGALTLETVTGRLPSRLLPAPIQNRTGRMAAGALFGGVEEGTQEALEGVGAAYGTNIGAQGRVIEDPQGEVFGNFILGFAAGAPVGAGGGIRSPGVPQGPNDDLLDAPVPSGAQPTPAPSSPMGPEGAVQPGASPVGPPPTTPAGPLSTAAARAPDRGVGGFEAGQPVNVFTPDTGTNYRGEFIGENAEGVVVRVGEQEFVFTDDMLAQGIQITDGTGQFPTPGMTQMPEAQTQVVDQPPPEAAAPTPAEQNLEAMIADRWQQRGNQITEDIQQDIRRIADEARSQNIRATLDSFVNRRLADLEQDRAPETMDPAEVDALVGTVDAQPTSQQPVPQTSPNPVSDTGAMAQTPVQEPRAGMVEPETAKAGDLAPVDQAAQETDPEPTEAQKTAGNYRKGKAKVLGFDVSIENAKGSERRGRDPDGNEWSVTMPAHYGYIKRTEGADGDQVDVYVSDGTPDGRVDDAPVFVVNQVDPDTRVFDEAKVMMGFPDEATALATYDAGFSDGRGPERRGSVTQMTAAEFREWLASGDQSQPTAPIESPDASEQTPLQVASDQEGDGEGVAATEPVADITARVNAWADGEGAALRLTEAERGYMVESLATDPEMEMDVAAEQALVRTIMNEVEDAPEQPASLDTQGAVENEDSIPFDEDDPRAAPRARPDREGAGDAEPDAAREDGEVATTSGPTPEGEATPPAQAGGEGREPGGREEGQAPAGAEKGKATGPDTDGLSRDEAFRAITEWLAQGSGRAGGWFRFNGESVTISFGQWWGRNRVKKPENYVFANASDAKDAWYFPVGLFPEQAPAGTEPTAPPPVEPTLDTPADRWKRLDQAGREAALRRTSFVGKRGDLLKPAQNSLDRDFDKLGKAVKEEVDAILSDDTAYQAILQDAQPETEMAEGVPNFNDPDAYPQPDQAEGAPARKSPAEAEAEAEAALADVFGGADATTDQETTPSETAVSETETAPQSNAGQETSPGTPRTAGQAATSAAKNVGMGLDDLSKGLTELFGGTNKLSSGLTFDSETYEKAKPYFIDAARKFAAAGADMVALAKALKAGFTDALKLDAATIQNMMPYFKQFLLDVDAGKIDPWAKEEADAGDNADAGSTGSENLEDVDADVSDDPRGGAGGTATSGGASTGGNGGVGDGAPDAGDSGPDAGGSLGNGGGAISADPAAVLTGENPGNFTITDDFALGEGAPKERIENNLAALRLLRELQAAGRYATKEEQAILARYVGWGGLKRAFDVKEADSTNVWGKAYRDLKDLLTDTEYNNALKSTRNAHYTSRTVVDAMWLAMRHMGVKGGRGLEPTVGTGNFLGLTPDGMNVEWYGTELDPMTGRIAQYLYPDATIFPGRGFEDAPFASGAYDFAIGNPPFGSNKVSDATPTTADLNGLKIHNYVMAKTARHLRPGGIMGMVVTSRFMDGASNAEGRDAMVSDGMKFLGGVRLPNTAFKANAGTEVVTDVLFFQKGRPGEASGISWTETAEVQTDQGPATINAYFAQNPDNVLGKNAKTGTMYQDAEYTVEDDGRDLRVALNNAFRKSLPQGAFGDPVEHQVDALMVDTRNDLPVGGLALMDDGRIFLNEQMGDSLRGTPVEVTPDSPWTNDAGDWVRVLNAARALRADPTPEAMREFREAAQAFMSWNAADEIFVKRKPKNKAEEAVYAIFDRVEAAGLTDGALNKRGLPDLIGEIEKIASKRQLGEDGFARLKAMLDLRNRVNALLNIERTTEGNETPEMKKARADLKKAYTTFKKKFGYLGDKVNSDILRGDIGMEQAVEASYQKPTGVKKDGTFVDSAAMEGPILERRVARPIEEITKADSPEDALIISMQERGRPDLPWMAALTGQAISDVRRDLMERDDPLLFRDPETNELVFVEEYLSGNVKEKLRQAREAGMEANVRALEDVQPPPVAQERVTPSMSATWIPAETLQEFLEDLGGRGAKVFRDLVVGVTEVDVSNFEPTPLGTPFQHPKANFARLARAAITGKAIVITEKQADGKSVKDEEASKSASALADQMGALFRQWAFQSPRRADELVERYNEVMNTRRERVWDGERYLRPKGANEVLIEKMRRTQKNGAWRMIQSPSSLMHHVVGAGKTWTATMAVMERKRLGLSKKPMVAVPNHLTEQWADEWRQVYPGANLLVVGGKDMNKDERRRMLARMATTDVDAIIISHQALSYIENDAAIEEAMLNESIATMREALDRARKEGQSKRTIGQIGTRIDNQEKKIQKLRERKTDKMAGVTFETLGVDYLAVDEAHLFKNLEYFSLGDRLVGMNDPNGSKRAFDLFVKTRSIRTRYKSGGISFLTGTPVSNSLVEIYTMLKYLAWDELKAEGLSEFDAFAGNYIEAETRFEITASQQVKERRVLAGLMNLSALAAQYRQFADIILRPDLERIYAETQREWNDAHPDEPPRSERFPTPKVKGGKRRLLTAPATETQRQVTDWLVARMAAIKAATDKKEYAKIDNPLVVLTDARKAGLDPRTIDPTQVRDKDSKVNRSAREIKRIYDQWQGDRGAQLVFSDLSTPVSAAKGQGKAMLKESAQKLLGKTKGNAWIAEMEAAGRDYVDRWEMLNERAVEMLDDEATSDADRRRIEEWMENVDPDMEATMLTLDSGFSMYDDLKAVLIEDHGIPESEIAFVHDAKNDEAKHALFDRVRKGEVRVLIGSTPKMGAGTNVQRRLVALHHLDAPWRPSDVEQREGRIVRSGNDLYARDPEGFEVELLAYSTEGTSDVVMWQVLERKAAAIEQFLSGAVDTMDEGESDSASFADFMAQSTGDSVFRDRLAQDAITTRLRSDIEGRELAKDSARRDLEWETRDATRRRAEKAAADAALETFKPLQEFIAAWPETKKTRADQKDPPALSPLEELAGIEAEERGKHEAAVDRWEKKVAEVRAERETMREKGVPEDRWPDVPVAPSRPGTLSQAVREKSTVSKAIYDALGQINPNDSSATVEAQYGNLGKIIVEAKGSRNVTSGQPTGSTFAQVFFQPKGSTDRVLVGGQETKNPQVAPEIQRNLWPSAIINAIANRATQNEERLTKIEERIPRLQELADSEIDRGELTQAEIASSYYSIAQNMAEKQADLDRLSRGDNPFILRDTKRPLQRAAQMSRSSLRRKGPPSSTVKPTASSAAASWPAWA
jgi:N12 class adenine-specific DNA methylase